MPKRYRVQNKTRKRLLDVAGELFAVKGFRQTGTREICRKAGADIAAIHYHFGSKEDLYQAVLKQADSLLVNPIPDMSGARTREARLRKMVEWVLLQCISQGKPGWQWKFVEQATLELTPGLEAFMRSRILPMYDALDSICREFLGDSATNLQVRLATRSILGQCFYYRHFRALIPISEMGGVLASEGMSVLTDHIVRFSIAGLNQQSGLIEAASARVPKKASAGSSLA